MEPMFAFSNAYRYECLITLLLFLSLVIGPLYKLGKQRPVLILLFSKALFTIFTLLIGFIFTINFSIVQFVPKVLIDFILVAGLFEGGTVQTLSLRLHLLALAINRTLAVYFPFWYERNVKFRIIWKICVPIWILSITMNKTRDVLKNAFNDLENFVWLDKLLDSGYWGDYALYAAAILYLFMSARLLYLKFTRNREVMNQSEADHVRICIVCMVGIVPFVPPMLPGEIFGARLLTFFNNDVNLIIVLIDIEIYFCMFTEDLCLLLLCRDFRALFPKMMPWIFCCCATQSSRRRIVVLPMATDVPMVVALPSSRMVEESGREQIRQIHPTTE